MSFKARLRQMKSRFEEARSARSAFEDLPDGRYVCKITKAYLHESESGKMFAVFSFNVIEGEEKGEVITDWNNLDHDVGLRIFCEKVKRLGSELPDDPTAIEDMLKEIAGDRPTVRLRLKTRKTDKGEFQGKNIEVEEEEEEDEESSEFSSGDHVKWSKGSGVIVSVDLGEGRAVIKRDSDGRKSRVMLTSLSPVETSNDGDDDDGEELEVGQSVEVDGKGEGTVVKIDEDNALVHVKLDSGKKVVADPEDVTILRVA
jgi:hypothetical protein